ncbi:MAG: RNA polymerase sigma factor [Actinomycetota bacterium]|nr:RNA polymerase sigma factor [Actinomycetota bacterium]
MEVTAPHPRYEGTALSFEEFFAVEHDRLYRALCLVTRNRHEAEEIMQDAFLALWARWERISNDVDDPTAYLYRSAMNAFRRRRRRAALAARKAVRLIPTDDSIERIEEQEAIVRALAALTPKQRAAVVLTNLLEFTAEEAGSFLGLSPGAVRTLASRGRADLRRQVGEEP